MLARVPEAQFFSQCVLKALRTDISTSGIWLATSDNPSCSKSIQGADNAQLLNLHFDLLSATPLLTTPLHCSLISHVTSWGKLFSVLRDLGQYVFWISRRFCTNVSQLQVVIGNAQGTSYCCELFPSSWLGIKSLLWERWLKADPPSLIRMLWYFCGK